MDSGSTRRAQRIWLRSAVIVGHRRRVAIVLVASAALSAVIALGLFGGEVGLVWAATLVFAGSGLWILRPRLLALWQGTADLSLVATCGWLGGGCGLLALAIVFALAGAVESDGGVVAVIAAVAVLSIALAIVTVAVVLYRALWRRDLETSWPIRSALAWVVSLWMLALATFAPVTWILAYVDAEERGIDYDPIGPASFGSDPPSLGDIVRLFFWHLSDAVPVIDVPGTLKWSVPLQYETAFIGIPLLLFKVAVIVPTIAAISRAWIASRPRAKDAHRD